MTIELTELKSDDIELQQIVVTEEFVRRTDLEVNGGQLYLGIQPKLIDGSDGPGWDFGDSKLAREFWINNIAKGPVSLRSRKVRRNGKRHLNPSKDDYLATLPAVTQVFMDMVLNLTDKVCVSRPNRMGERVYAQIPNPERTRFVIEIARAGITTSRKAQGELQRFSEYEVNILHSGSQRENNLDGSKSPNFKNKGRAIVKDADMVIVDPANATGGSAADIVTDFLKVKCKGKPHQLFFCFFYTCPEGIQRVFNAFPGAIIIAGMLNEGMNEDKYLISPGCGDVGAMEYGVPD